MCHQYNCDSGAVHRSFHMSSDERLYASRHPIKEWTAPERLALASLLHGGPIPDITQYRVLEIGCGAGANLIPLAYYRPQAQFIGIDQDGAEVGLASARSTALNQPNLSFRRADRDRVEDWPEGPFDFILMHDTTSRVPTEILDQVFDRCSKSLSPTGLLYLNYDSQPGWQIRGLVREYLLAHTREVTHKPTQTRQAQLAAVKMMRSLEGSKHPYSQLLALEFKQVSDASPDELGHTYLSDHQRAFWRSDLLDWAKQFGLHYVADVDDNAATQRSNAFLRKQIESQDLIGTNLPDTEDLLSYRMNHMPLFCKQPIKIRQPSPENMAHLHIAACLRPVGPHRPGWYQHPNGYQLQASETALVEVFEQLLPKWPQCAPLATLMETWEQHIDDILELHQSGLLELRLPNAIVVPDSPNLNTLNQMELQWFRHYTTPLHQQVSKRS